MVSTPIKGFTALTAALLLFGVGDSAQSASTPKRIKGTGKTISLNAFQVKHGFSNAEMKQRFGAVGRISCPFGTATAFLIEQPYVFVTSDHVFVIPEKKAMDRGRSSKCMLQFFYSKKRYSIKPKTLIHGLRTTKSAYNFEWFDWAIGQLNEPVEGVQPIVTGPSEVLDGTKVTMVSQGINDMVPRVCIGEVSSSIGNTSVNTFTTSCDTGPGTSGGPILLGPIDQAPRFPQSAIGLTWGYDFPYWQVSLGVTHLALPLADAEIQKALKRILTDKAGQ